LFDCVAYASYAIVQLGFERAQCIRFGPQLLLGLDFCRLTLLLGVACDFELGFDVVAATTSSLNSYALRNVP
jgi:hypothetical protein